MASTSFEGAPSKISLDVQHVKDDQSISVIRATYGKEQLNSMAKVIHSSSPPSLWKNCPMGLRKEVP